MRRPRRGPPLAGPLPDPATPDDYERILRPLYGLAFGAAQALPAAARRSGPRALRAAWELLAGERSGAQPRPAPQKSRAARAAFPVAVAAVNRLLRADFDADISATRSSAAGSTAPPRWRAGSASTAAT